VSDSKAELRFREQLDELEADAKAVGLTKRGLAEAAGVSPATLPRWRRKPPVTVRTVAKMQKAIDAKRVR
jgi:hypothetical protein